MKVKKTTSKAPRQPLNPKVSLILVTYTEVPELLNCLKNIQATQSSKKSPGTPSFEILVVDNAPPSTLETQLKKKFPEVKYISSGGNIGFGPANNVGARHARGKYLFFLNPDTQMEPGTIRELADFLDHRPEVGVVAPTLSDMDGQPYADQGSRRLTPVTGIFSYSLVNRLWPRNPIVKHYFFRDRDASQPVQLSVVPGTALMVRGSVFKAIGGFDEQFFIYFEENDLCRRIIDAGSEVWQIPQANMKHIWHAATQGSKYNRIFQESRYKYFKKYYGPVVATVLELIFTTGKWRLITIAVIGVIAAVILRLYVQ